MRLTDGLKLAGIILNDCEKKIRQPKVQQQKVEHLADEHVEIREPKSDA